MMLLVLKGCGECQTVQAAAQVVANASDTGLCGKVGFSYFVVDTAVKCCAVWGFSQNLAGHVNRDGMCVAEVIEGGHANWSHHQQSHLRQVTL